MSGVVSMTAVPSAHAMTVNVDNYIGNTGTASHAHSHQVDLDPFVGSSGNAGSGAAFNITQPLMLMNYIIKT
jgi:hypothetical protein